MNNFLNRLFNVRAEEAGLVAILSFLLMGNTVGRQMAGIVGIADVINVGGVNQTLLVNAINGVLILVTAALASLIVDRFNRIELMRWMAFAFALIFVGLRFIEFLNVPPQLNAALVYLMSQQQWLIFPMFFWVLVNDVFEVAQAKRLIPLIGSWTFIGKLIGIGLTLLPGYLGQWGIIKERQITVEMALAVNIFIYLAAFALISFGLRRVKLREVVKSTETLPETLAEGWGFLREVPAYRFLLLSLTCIAVCDVIIEFRFFAVAKAALTDPIAYKEFYALYLLAAAVISFAIQAFLTSRIIAWLQLKNTFLIQPTVALSSTLAMLASSLIAVVTPASLFIKIFRNTVDESTHKAFRGLVPEERRGRVALFMDNYAPAVGLLLGSVIAGSVVYGSLSLGFKNDYYIYLGITAALALVALVSVWQMRRVYDTSLFNWRLKRRKRGAELLGKLEL